MIWKTWNIWEMKRIGTMVLIEMLGKWVDNMRTTWKLFWVTWIMKELELNKRMGWIFNETGYFEQCVGRCP